MATSTPEKVRENLLRRMAQRQGLELRKSRRRDPLAADYGRFWLVDPRGRRRGGAVVYGGEWGATLDEVEDRLTEGRS